MPTECERVFSAAKKTITPERNALSERVIEACECLKAWWRNKVHICHYRSYEEKEGKRYRRGRRTGGIA
jgi:hypothetical protein